jgi:hypothetical protein
MSTARVAETEVPRQCGLRFRPVRAQVNLFAFDAPSQPLDEHDVDPAVLTAYTAGEAGVAQRFALRFAGELDPPFRSRVPETTATGLTMKSRIADTQQAPGSNISSGQREMSRSLPERRAQRVLNAIQ